jgi:hypothetical protein
MARPVPENNGEALILNRTPKEWEILKFLAAFSLLSGILPGKACMWEQRHLHGTPDDVPRELA